jgi:SH3-like domain-containing protein
MINMLNFIEGFFFPLHATCKLLNKVIPRFTSLIRSSKTARKAKTRETKINFRYFPTGTTIGLREEGARISKNWLVN